jgi:hypothetical protein
VRAGLHSTAVRRRLLIHSEISGAVLPGNLLEIVPVRRASISARQMAKLVSIASTVISSRVFPGLHPGLAALVRTCRLVAGMRKQARARPG